MKNYCAGSQRPTGGWPGDQDVCPVCQRWIRLRRDGSLGKHTGKAVASWMARDFLKGAK